MASFLSRVLSFPKNNPVTFGVGFSCAKTSAADLMVQTQLEKREKIDWRRNSAFALFGFFYLGGVQYALYVPVFGRLFPKAAEFASKPLREKLKDGRGWINMLAQVFLDQCLHHPFLYFPAFYSLKEAVAGNSPIDGLYKYSQNYQEDMLALWKVWVPATIVNFTFSPMWLRIPFVASTSMIWSCILSAMRGSDDLPAEEAADIFGNQGRAFEKAVLSPKLHPNQEHILLMAHGPDRIGLVASVASAVRGSNGSISESKMVRMGGEFMLMMVVSVDMADKADLTKLVKSSVGQSMSLVTKDISDAIRLSSSIRSRSTGQSQQAELRAWGDDKPGIIAEITALLHTYGINIDRLETKVRPTYKGNSEFEIVGIVEVQPGMNVRKIRDASKAVEDKLGVSLDLNLSPNFKATSSKVDK